MFYYKQKESFQTFVFCLVLKVLTTSFLTVSFACVCKLLKKIFTTIFMANLKPRGSRVQISKLTRICGERVLLIFVWEAH